MATEKKNELVTIREFARRKNVNESTVRRSIKRGRITADRDGRKVRIPWERASQEFEDRRDLSQVRPKDAKKIKASLINNDTSFEADGEKKDLWNERALKEHYLARIRKLDYLERSGELVCAKAVEDTAFNKARQIRDGLLNIPDRIASIVASEADTVRCHGIIAAEIESVLNNLTKNDP